MPATLNVRSADFARRHLFLADPDPGFPTRSMAAAELATLYCEHEGCPGLRPEGPNACRKHANGMVLGVSKLIAAGELLGEVSFKGVLFVRLSPLGVMVPSTWRPQWWDEESELVEWARGKLARSGSNMFEDEFEVVDG